MEKGRQSLFWFWLRAARGRLESVCLCCVGPAASNGALELGRSCTQQSRRLGAAVVARLVKIGARWEGP